MTSLTPLISALYSSVKVTFQFYIPIEQNKYRRSEVEESWIRTLSKVGLIPSSIDDTSQPSSCFLAFKNTLYFRIVNGDVHGCNSFRYSSRQNCDSGKVACTVSFTKPGYSNPLELIVRIGASHEPTFR